MKIAFCLHHFLPTHIAGTEIYVFNLAVHLKAMGVDTLVIIPNLGSDSNEEYEHDGIRVIKYAENSVEDRAMILGKTRPDGLSRFVTVLKDEQPDVVHFHELAPGRGFNIFHVQAVHQLQVPVVLTFHLSGYTCFKGSLMYKDVTKCDGQIKIRRCTECVYQSKKITGIKGQVLTATAMSLFKTGINTTVLNNSIATAFGFPFVISKIKNDLLRLTDITEKIIVLANWYKVILEKNGVAPEKLVYVKQGLTNGRPQVLNNAPVSLPLKVVFIGRISPLKGLHLLIDAISTLPDEKISLHIYGQQTGDGYAAECTLKSGSKKNIHWMGAIAPADVIATLSRYHLLCLPSTFSEMSPLVIPEAFAAGLPVLASDVYGNAEQIKEGVNGWLFRFNDSADLADKLKRLAADKGMVQKARLNLPPANMFKNLADIHVELYNEIAANQRRIVKPLSRH